MPPWLRKLPLPLRLVIMAPLAIIGGLLAFVVQAILINLGAGNQHLSDPDTGFVWWLLWPIILLGLLIGLGLAGLVYLGVGLGADEDYGDEDEGGPETGMIEV